MYKLVFLGHGSNKFTHRPLPVEYGPIHFLAVSFCVNFFIRSG